MYDSEAETKDHMKMVLVLGNYIVKNLKERLETHDASKLSEEEKKLFDVFTPFPDDCIYGSEEYINHLENMKIALEHHYKMNKHHPEHYVNGIIGMSLIDLVEMIVDWKAASMRHIDGDILRSIEVSQKRFGYSDDLKQILINTIKEMNWE